MPKLLIHQGYYLDVFYTLSEWRGFLPTGDLAPLTLKEVLTYCEMFDIHSLQQRETLVFHIKRLDTAYMRNRAKRLQDSDSETGKQVKQAEVDAY